MRRTLPLVMTLALLLAGAGCANDDEDTVTVYAAASLTAVFEQLAEEFEAEHEGVDVELSLGGSADLATQIEEGAPADVFASADAATMARLAGRDGHDGLDGHDGRDVVGAEVFATNTLTIAVPPGNPAGITTLADLGAAGVDLVVCAPEVPCGAAARAVADRAGFPLRPVSEEQSVTDVLGKVAAGEADAGLVYVTDVRAAGDDVEGIAVPEAAAVVNDYPIAALGDDPLARAFVDLVLSPTGREVLAAAGFGPP